MFDTNIHGYRVLLEKIDDLATIQRAKEYAADPDKYIYALDTMRHELDMTLPINSDRTDHLVEYFESALDRTLEEKL